MSRSVIGLDIGGANLKAAHTSGATCFKPFPLWKYPHQLTEVLTQLLMSLPGPDLIAVTMTGELCDCFETKRDGVLFILDAVKTAVRETPLFVWLTEGRFARLKEARSAPLLAAAGNWLALATFAGRLVGQRDALLVDIGSTTTDIVPLSGGCPVPKGRTDPERLRTGELVYTGVSRTPLCALLGAPYAAEFFATTLDAYLLLGEIGEKPDDCETADNRPATKAAAHARIARMFCADADSCTSDEAQRLALTVRAKQLALLERAAKPVLQRLSGPPSRLVFAGSGEFLARQLALAQPNRIPVLSLQDTFGPDISRAACAYALAVLAAEEKS